MISAEIHVANHPIEMDLNFERPIHDSGIFAQLYLKELRRELYNYFTNQDIKSEYVELCDTITLTFKIGDRIKRYHFLKHDPYCACVGKSCGCSCLTEGRLRHLEITDCNGNKNFFKTIKDKTTLINLDEAGIDNHGHIKFSDGLNHLEVSTKLIWVWCNRSLKIGEFEEGPRRQQVRMRSSLTTFDSPIAELIGA
jgi:hypothetical protein